MNTASFSPSVRRSGFTLIELLVVIAIIGILAGILISALPGIQAKIERDRTRTFIAEINNGLVRYQQENAIFPMSPADGSPSTDRDGDGIKGSSILYKELSGDENLDGKVDPETTVYVARIDYATSQSSKNPRSAKSGSDYVLIDPSGSQIRYLCEKPAAKKKLTFNPNFDIWSVMDSPDDQSKWITNWQSN
ncbi:MAG: prepilin-type N-terminal cleavage/methylation domain-containing protein [Verrucomicrobiales bacterium]